MADDPDRHQSARACQTCGRHRTRLLRGRVRSAITIRLPWLDEGAETNADMWATAEESREEIVALYLRAAVHADATIEALTLDSPGRVPWWSPPERQQITLQQIMVHVTAEIARHAGHADILRELIDGAAGDNNGELPDQTANQWATYRLQLQEAAVEAARRTEMGDPDQPRTP